MLTSRFDDALTYASRVHRSQVRNGTSIPYVGHLLGVASTVLEYGGDEDQAIGALLHDAAEDQGGEPRLADIHARFGERVAAIVRDCSDSLATDPAEKKPWRERKEDYIRHLQTRGYDSILVSLSDKASNARSILRDLNDPAVGPALWDRFNAKREGTLWYYGQLARAYQDVLRQRNLERSRLFQLALELQDITDRMKTF